VGNRASRTERDSGEALTQPIPGGYSTPSEFEATLTWGNGVKQVVRTTVDDSPFGVALKPDGQRNGVRFQGTNGWIWVNRTTINSSDPEILDTPMVDPPVRLEVSDDHMRNFFDAVGTRKDPICPAEDGHRSATVGHLIVIALRTGRALRWDPSKEKFIGEEPGKRTRTSHGGCASRTTTASLDNAVARRTLVHTHTRP
jgi:predicted dehydrogenase